MKPVKLVVLACLCGVAVSASAKDKESLKDRLKDQAVQMVISEMSTNELNEVASFFGSVSEKYKPTFEKFWTDFGESKDRMAVLVDYLPKAEEAYADAKAMKVPAKFAAKKEEYLNKFDQILSTVKLSAAMLGVKRPEKAAKAKKEAKNEK